MKLKDIIPWLLILFGAAFAIYVFLFDGCNPEKQTLTIPIDSNEFVQLTQDYQAANPGETWGGMIDKATVAALLQGLGSEEYVKFRLSNQEGGTSLMFKGVDASGTVVCVRNGGDPAAFCPSNCPFTAPSGAAAAASISLAVTLEAADFDLVARAFTGGTGEGVGGQIDKEALQAVINTIDPTDQYLRFRFCTDPSEHKLSVIFIGGTQGTGGVTALVRNGGAEEAFCPNVCPN